MAERLKKCCKDQDNNPTKCCGKIHTRCEQCSIECEGCDRLICFKCFTANIRCIGCDAGGEG